MFVPTLGGSVQDLGQCRSLQSARVSGSEHAGTVRIVLKTSFMTPRTKDIRIYISKEVALGLLALSRPPRVGRPLFSLCPSPVPAIKKRRKGLYSVSDSLRLQNVGIYLKKRSRRGVCSANKIQSRPHSKC
ncbi:hypothetical protein RRG08_013545 [Elysia crispata]|uniref:Uncharacterized protein n=1 Tax=Elysia crispata TaxID=231223 RepID=A0AAE0Y157_9GAST|nr:hypothetical protein RRG08_013545 [Elysia crispata]